MDEKELCLTCQQQLQEELVQCTATAPNRGVGGEEHPEHRCSDATPHSGSHRCSCGVHFDAAISSWGRYGIQPTDGEFRNEIAKLAHDSYGFNPVGTRIVLRDYGHGPVYEVHLDEQPEEKHYLARAAKMDILLADLSQQLGYLRPSSAVMTTLGHRGKELHFFWTIYSKPSPLFPLEDV